MKKLFSLLTLFLFGAGCAGASVFQPVPLNANPPVLAQPIFFAIDETTARGYLLNSNNSVNWANGSLMVLDLTNPTAPNVINAVAINSFSGQAVLDTANQLLYVTNRLTENGSDNTDQIFAVNINPSSPAFLTMAQFDSEPNPFGITSDGTNLYLSSTAFLDRYLIGNLSSRTEVSFNIQTTTGTTPNTFNTTHVAISPTGQFLFVTNRNDVMLILNKDEIPLPDPTIALTSGGSEAVDYVVSNTFSTRGVASDSNYVYVVEGSPPSLDVLTDRTLPVVTGQPQQILISTIGVANIPLGNDPEEIALDTVNNRAYVVNALDNTVSVIDTNLLTEIARIGIPDGVLNGQITGANPFGISVGHFGGVPYIYVLNQNTNNIAIINGNTLSLVSLFPF